MIDVVVLGVGGFLCTAFGAWFIRRQHRRRLGTRAAWGVVALGLGLLVRAASFLDGSHEVFGLILSACYAVLWIGGFMLVRSDRDTPRYGGGRKRRKLPPLRP